MRNANRHSANNANAPRVSNSSLHQWPRPRTEGDPSPLSNSNRGLELEGPEQNEAIDTMFHRGHLDRREFLTLSTLTTAATLLPNSLHATQSSQPGLVSLRVTGDAQSGYGVTILFRDRPISRHHQGGELSAIFQNSERSLEDRADDWKA